MHFVTNINIMSYANGYSLLVSERFRNRKLIIIRDTTARFGLNLQHNVVDC